MCTCVTKMKLMTCSLFYSWIIFKLRRWKEKTWREKAGKRRWMKIKHNSLHTGIFCLTSKLVYSVHRNSTLEWTCGLKKTSVLSRYGGSPTCSLCEENDDAKREERASERACRIKSILVFSCGHVIEQYCDLAHKDKQSLSHCSLFAIGFRL